MYNTLNPFITMIELNLFGEPETVIFDTLEEMSWKEFIDNPIIPGNIIMKSHNFIIPKDCLSTISILKNSLEVDEIINQYTISNIKLSKEGLLENLDITDNITGEQRTLYDWDIRKIDREEILLDEQFNKGTVINTLGGFRGAHYIEEYDLYIATSFGIDGIIKFIQKLLNHAELPDSSVIISFKA